MNGVGSVPGAAALEPRNVQRGFSLTVLELTWLVVCHRRCIHERARSKLRPQCSFTRLRMPYPTRSWLNHEANLSAAWEHYRLCEQPVFQSAPLRTRSHGSVPVYKSGTRITMDEHSSRHLVLVRDANGVRQDTFVTGRVPTLFSSLGALENARAPQAAAEYVDGRRSTQSAFT